MKFDVLTNRISVPVLLFLVNLFLVSPVFFLTLNEINPFDEAAYLNTGRALLEGSIPSFADNPLMGIFYGILYLLLKSSPFWLLHSATAGRIIQFTLLWLGIYLIAKRLADFSHPLIMVGIFFVTPLVIDSFRFPSDPLFTALAAFSFWQLLHFKERRERKHLWLASLFMGLAALARNDGLVLFVILVFVAVVFDIPPGRRFPEKRWWTVLVPSITPFVVLVGGYFLIYGAITGDFELGTLKRTYDNFEAGHLAIYGGTGELNQVIEAKLEARRVFGTPEENGYSVFSAISRNPQAYFQRVFVVSKSLPEDILHAYGIRFAVLLFALAFRGIVELVIRKQYRLLLLFTLWPVHMVTGFLITIFRAGHLRFPYYLVFALAAIGLAAVVRNIVNRNEFFVWVTALLGISLYGVLDNKLAIYYGAVVFLIAIVIIYVIKQQFGEGRQFAPAILLVLLVSGVVIRGNFPSPHIRDLDNEAKEQALLYMAENFPPGSRVAAGSPGVVYAAKMSYASLTSTDVPRNKNDEEFLAWLVNQNITGIYVDHSLYNDNPFIWDLIKPQIKNGLDRVFVGDEGDIQVLVVKGNE